MIGFSASCRTSRGWSPRSAKTEQTPWLGNHRRQTLADRDWWLLAGQTPLWPVCCGPLGNEDRWLTGR
jgi:hypothetical protein